MTMGKIQMTMRRPLAEPLDPVQLEGSPEHYVWVWRDSEPYPYHGIGLSGSYTERGALRVWWDLIWERTVGI